jgi:hypothetical protein
MLSAATFKTRFPTFSAIPDALVTEKLAQAARSMDETVWDDHFDDGQAQKAAHLLALTPEGGEAGLRMGAGANQRTVYQDEFDKLERMVGTSHRMVLE